MLALHYGKVIINLIFHFLIITQAVWATSVTFPDRIALVSRDIVRYTLYRVFQVYPPVLPPKSSGKLLTNEWKEHENADVRSGTSECPQNQLLVNHVFANSYGKPFVGLYIPPACDFNRVTFNLTVVSAGNQFDRLGIVYLGDTEVWRTSTAEPTKYGIVWTYIKDMSHYKALFQEPQKLIFDLGNLIYKRYTASFNVTLQATFSSVEESPGEPADTIIPVSARKSSENQPSAWSVPSSVASNKLALPRNIRRAVFSIAATGQMDEEFWYNNVLSSDIKAFPGTGTMDGFSPFREVQLLIDDGLAGVVWPFPIVFTGGIVPGLWRPIVGIDAFDLKEDEIDITPFLPVLCDGKEHKFEIRVVGISDDGKGHGELSKTVGQYWVVTGKIFIWESTDPTATSATVRSDTSPPTIEISSTVKKAFPWWKPAYNETMAYDVKVTRHMQISSTFEVDNKTKHASWTQDLKYSNQGRFTDQGQSQITDQISYGEDTSSEGYSRRFNYPLFVKDFEIEKSNGDLTIDASLNRTQDIQITGQPTFPSGLESFAGVPGIGSQPNLQSTHLVTSQNGSGHYFNSPARKETFGFGRTEQNMTFSVDPFGFTEPVFRASRFPGRFQGLFDEVMSTRQLYQRHVVAVNGSVVENEEKLVGKPVQRSEKPPLLSPIEGESFADTSARGLLGRGPNEKEEKRRVRF